jgi:hypothetical protein
MNRLYKDLDQKEFLKRSAILLWLADLLTCLALYLKWTTREDLIKQVMVELGKRTPQIQNISEGFVRQMITIFQQSLLLLFCLVLLYHGIVYYFYQKDSYLARKYVNFSAITSSIGLVLYLVAVVANPYLYDLFIVIGLIFYAYYFFAPKKFKVIKTGE